MTDPNDDMLDDIFAQARAVTPDPSADLMARILADVVSPASEATLVAGPGLWARLSGMLGGWPALGSLLAATVAGIWIGVAPPATVEDFAASLLGDAVTVSLFAQDGIFDLGDLADG
ncbi:hypothetical protein [Yoonia sp.]|uniref:hypothetical protein n=1 Tax=Yoonia sp. TaxID=2212373 RepID=UPI0025E5B247|nr:hypothetical protein [Yoonia sp.]